MTLYLALMYLVSLAFSYILAFTSATLSIGKSLSTTATPTGFQDAITPPRFSTLALIVYGISLGSFIYGFWKFGLLTGLGVTIAFLFAVAVNIAAILPKSDSEHFRKIIIHSMINRHADYLKSGDNLRASVMAELLAKLGLPVDEFLTRMKESGDA